MATQAQITAVQQLYVSYLGRAADKAGLDFWSNAIANGTSTIESVATGLTLATEYTTAYGNLSNDALVDAVYTNVLGRPADAAGKAFWVAAFGNGTVKADTFVASLIQSLGAQDQATINNKTFVAQTYTDTVGSAYTPAGGTAVITGVTSDPQTVTDKIAAINTGTIPGQVPGLSLINASVAAQDAVTAFGKTTAASNAALDVNKDGSVSASEVDTALTAATAARFDATTGVSVKTTAQLNADVTDTAAALAAEKADVTAVTGGAAAITAYDNAIAAQKVAVDANTAAASSIAAAQAGLNTAVAATGATVTLTTLGAAAGTTFADAKAITTWLSTPANAGTPAQANLVAELNKVPTYGAGVVDSGVKGLAVATTTATVATATTTLNAIDTGSTATAGVKNDYIADKAAATKATDLVTKAVAADAKVAEVKVVSDQYAALTKTAGDAAAAITKFANDNASKVSIQDVAGTPSADSAKAVSDVFYFKSAVATANDKTIANFGSGDSIVLGSAYTQGASFAAGDNNKLEYFFVKTDTGTQVVLETAAYGSSEVTANASTGVAASTTDHLAVITLTGVNVADLTVSNGVISHVA